MCGSKPADIVFVLDSSESEKEEGFKKEIDFAYRFARQFQIGPSNVQFSSVSFSSEVRNDFFLNTYHGRHDVLNAIQNLQFMSQGTNTSYALQFVRENSFLPKNGGRQNATKIVIVITDGASSNPPMTAHEANLLKHIHANIFAIGIGTEINQNELSHIVSSRHNHVFTVDNFDLLHTIQHTLEDAACGGRHHGGR